jgi:2-dehydro-3-deoxy-D-arabinonate dehydratase
LPQAKVYDKSASIGPCILITQNSIPPSTKISMAIERNGELVFEGDTSISKMKRSHEELVGFLFRECSFPTGCYLMTGTCVVPENDFTLQKGDKIIIGIEHIGSLANIVE